MLPVSYTHLDVYKRQVYEHTRCCHPDEISWKSHLLYSNPLVPCGTWSVSYTHLDVYKRQVGKGIGNGLFVIHTLYQLHKVTALLNGVEIGRAHV